MFKVPPAIRLTVSTTQSRVSAYTANLFKRIIAVQHATVRRIDFYVTKLVSRSQFQTRSSQKRTFRTSFVNEKI